MSEIDYQMALLLQHRFEQEGKALKDTEKADEALAKLLQEEFAQEQSPVPKKSLNSSKCLVDPSWELVDPTPDIHALFLLFNERFFWNKLLAVCVSWSKRMTSCAGICSYQGRGGLCSITLSEPLLKLRPRKDLVETLLHEMIHAYLFVTDNNRDRDGHGPEFHKHMYRINKESGTNITVYHSFHDEVRLYQQHWWRCNGPCQHRKPYFGMVRRATNRAPGPNDRWFGEHSRTCGGTFIKVKEPEKQAKKPEKKTVNSGRDIRDFMTKTGNVHGLKDVKGGVKGKYNSASTIVITNNKNTTSTYKPTVVATSTNSKPMDVSCSEDFLSVRNHWANKFNTSNKRPLDEQPSSSKVQMCECPICNKRLPMPDLNAHLDECLTQPKETKEEVSCLACGKKILKKDLNEHLDKCMIDIFHEDNKENESGFNCPFCMKVVEEKEMKQHLDQCLNMEDALAESLLCDF